MTNKALDKLGLAIANAGYEWTPEMRSAYETGIRKSEWVGLTDEEIVDCSDYPVSFGVPFSFAKAIEAKLREKNTF